MRVLTHEVCPDYGPAQPCCRYCGTMAEYADAVAHRDCPDDAFAPLPEECPKCGTFVPREPRPRASAGAPRLR